MEGLFCYPFHFVHTFNRMDSEDPSLLRKLLYSFDSTNRDGPSLLVPSHDTKGEFVNAGTHFLRPPVFWPFV